MRGQWSVGVRDGPQMCECVEMMRTYFARYGNVTDCRIIQDRLTRRSKGYGFCEFSLMSSVDKVMKEYPTHVIGGKWVQVCNSYVCVTQSSSLRSLSLSLLC